MTVKRVLGVAVAVLGMAAASLVVASPASATTASSDCNPRPYGPMCYYFHSGYTGARAGIVPAVGDLYAYEFSNTGDGAYQDVANNAGSGSNRDSTCVAIIWEHVNSTGDSLVLNRYNLTGYQNSTLGALNNDNRSQSWTCG